MNNLIQFDDKCVTDPKTGCWLWTGGCDGRGYGRIRRKGRNDVQVTRVVWEREYGPITGQLNVLHKCDVPRCVNLSHLFLGTQLDNVRDMINKGRGTHLFQPREKNGKHVRLRENDASLGNCGEQSHFARLKEEQVLKIRIMLNCGLRCKDIAVLFQVGVTTIKDIKLGKSWRHMK